MAESFDLPTDATPCVPWGPSCDRLAASLFIASCCGKRIPLCVEHAAESQIEFVMDSMPELKRICLGCGALAVHVEWSEISCG